MNYSICLDQFSTNFNVNNLSSNGFSIYTNLDNFTTPIAQNIPYQDLFSPPIGNCPYVANLPQGATQLVVIDACTSMPTDIASIFNPSGTTAGNLTTTCCYAVINVPAQPIAFCDTADLEFDIFSSSYIGQIVAGNLTSNIGTVTDYKIGWYKDGDYSAPGFTSGYGQAFSPYQFTHPLTGNSAVPSLAGDWEGIIHDIAINGTTYSSVSGSANGTPIPFESCFDTIVIEPLECGNGAYQGIAKYSHQFNFNSQAAGTTSAPVSLTYALNPTTKYFAYSFNSYGVWDEIEIKWKSGNPSATSNPSLYTQSIYLEKLKRGTDLPILPQDPSNVPNYDNTPGLNVSNYLTTVNNTWPKTSPMVWDYGLLGGEMRRVLSLTNLATSSNPSFPDLIEITITPNPTNNNTQWKAGFQCLEDFDGTNCNFSNWKDSLPKISTINLVKDYNCDNQKIILTTSGCLQNSDAFSYGDPFTSLNGSLIDSLTYQLSNVTNLTSPGNGTIPLVPIVSCNSFQSYDHTCGPSSTGTITLNKTFQQLQLTFSLESDYLYYKNSLLNAYAIHGSPSCPQGCNAGCGTIPFNENYYKIFTFGQPIQGANTNCGDNTTIFQTQFSLNDYCGITYVENPPSNFWSITIPQSTLINCYPIDCECDTCYSVLSGYITQYNSYVNNTNTFTFTTNVGAKCTSPFGRRGISRSFPPVPSGSYCATTNIQEDIISLYSTHTIPFIPSPQSPTGWVNLPSLGASLPCDFSYYPEPQMYYSEGIFYKGAVNYFQIHYPHLGGNGFNPSLSTDDFEIYTLSNLTNTGSNDASNQYPIPCTTGNLIYRYSSSMATVYSSSYFVGGSPTLIIN
jgi:hypothetical protein